MILLSDITLERRLVKRNKKIRISFLIFLVPNHVAFYIFYSTSLYRGQLASTITLKMLFRAEKSQVSEYSVDSSVEGVCELIGREFECHLISVIWKFTFSANYSN